MNRSIFIFTALLTALWVSSSYAAYNGARNYESKPAAAKASSSGSFFGKSYSKGSSKGKASYAKSGNGFKSGGYKK